MKISLGHKITLSFKLHSSNLRLTFTLKEKVQVCMKLSAGNISRMTLIINYLYQENGLLDLENLSKLLCKFLASSENLHQN